MTRDKIIKELERIKWMESPKVFAGGECDINARIADFILARDRLLLEKIGRPLREIKDEYNNCLPPNTKPIFKWGKYTMHTRIDEALAIIEKEGL